MKKPEKILEESDVKNALLRNESGRWWLVIPSYLLLLWLLYKRSNRSLKSVRRTRIVHLLTTIYTLAVVKILYYSPIPRLG